MNKLLPDILELFEHIERKVEASPGEMKDIEELKKRVQELELLHKETQLAKLYTGHWFCFAGCCA